MEDALALPPQVPPSMPAPLLPLCGRPCSDDEFRDADAGVSLPSMHTAPMMSSIAASMSLHWTCQSEGAHWPPRSRFGSVVLPNGHILVFGGLVGPRNDVWRSVDRGLSWECVTLDAPWSARWGTRAIAMPCGTIALLGGVDSTGCNLNDIWQSTNGGKDWEVVPEASWCARVGHGVVTLPGGVLLLMGGLGSDCMLNDIWKSIDGGRSWQRIADAAPWSPRSWFGLVATTSSDGWRLVLFGGVGDSNHLFSDVWCSHDGGTSWEQLVKEAPWAPRRGHHVAVLPGNAILMMGGRAAHSELNDIWVSANGGLVWGPLPEAPWLPRSDAGVVSLPGGSVLIFGGHSKFTGRDAGDVWKVDQIVLGKVALPCGKRLPVLPAPDSEFPQVHLTTQPAMLSSRDGKGVSHKRSFKRLPTCEASLLEFEQSYQQQSGPSWLCMSNAVVTSRSAAPMLGSVCFDIGSCRCAATQSPLSSPRRQQIFHGGEREYYRKMSI